MRTVNIIRIDPETRKVAMIPIKARKDISPDLRRIIGSRTLGSRKIMDFDGTGLVVIGALDVDEAVPMWKFPGGDDNAGVSILMGQTPIDTLLERGVKGNDVTQMFDVPIGVAWVLERIQWLDGEQPGEREERAREILHALDDDIRAALKEAVVAPAGVWISEEAREKLGEAMIALGIGTERSGGQQLSGLGEAVFDLMAEER